MCFGHLRKTIHNWKSFFIAINLNVRYFTISYTGIYNIFCGYRSLRTFFIGVSWLKPTTSKRYYIFSNGSKVI